ncbi:PTS sugar transporter subunit IIC [Lacticaseibacillus sp. 53-4]|uniref:PTS sugar transporter subunit IIC n=1 Tax=Lacticaseibacillus sp. 53-4 TaxID=2799575 RepID=UPI001944B405|nr:PTS transporter subunit EIIC [Lacticaseibacillus sp. 53-4]
MNLQKIGEKILPVVGKISNQKHLAAIRDGFIMAMPMSLVGSVGLLLQNFRINLVNTTLPLDQDPFQKFLVFVFGKHWTAFPNAITNVCNNLISIVVTVTIAYMLTENYIEAGKAKNKYQHADPLVSAIIALLGSFLVFPQSTAGKLGNVWTQDSFGATSLILGMIVALLSTAMYVHLSDTKLTIKLPDSVPPAILNAFASVIPLAISVIVINAIEFIIRAFGFTGMQDLIYKLVQAPLQGVGTSVGGAFITVIAQNLVFFFGIHPAALSPIFEPIKTINQNDLTNQLLHGASVMNLKGAPIGQTLQMIMGLTTVSVCVAIFLVARQSPHYMSIAQLELIPGIFNIGEPMIYGLPIVLNPFMLIPYVFASAITSTIYYWLELIHAIPAIAIAVPWTTPPFLNTYLASGGHIMPVLVQIICFVFDVMMFIPFVKMAIRSEANNAALNAD